MLGLKLNHVSKRGQRRSPETNSKSKSMEIVLLLTLVALNLSEEARKCISIFHHFSRLTHWGQDKMAAILLRTFWRAFSWMQNVWAPNQIWLKFVDKGLINNIQALVQIMAWSRPGYKSLSEPMMVSLPTIICISQPQWVKMATVVEILPQGRQGPIYPTLI